MRALALFLITCVILKLSAEPYLENRLSPSHKRYNSMALALALMEERGSKVLVETGTARTGALNFAGDGGSTIIWSHWAFDHAAHLYSVDISSLAVALAQQATLAYWPSVEIVLSDSVKFLEDFNQPIDFLYLDSYDFDVKKPIPSQWHHLKEIIAAYPKLHAQSLVMIDDCDLPHGGKGVLVIKYLKNRGWKVIYNGYQVILSPAP